MTAPTPHVDPDGDRLRAYLLGGLSEQERHDLESRYIADDEQFAVLQEAQYDLIDAYVRGELGPAEGRQVEERLLASAEGRRRERLARALHMATKRPALSAITAQRAHPVRTTMWFAAAAAIAVMGVGLVWLGGENLRLRRQLADVAARPTIADPSPATPASTRTADAIVADATLSLQVLRSDQPVTTVHVPPSARVIRLTLPIDDRAAAFTIGLERAGVGRVWTQTGAAPTDERRLTIWVSSDALVPGDYEALVWRGPEGAENLLSVYPFRVKGIEEFP